LHQEGWDIEVITDRDRFERAWSGRLDPKLRNREKRLAHNMKILRQRAEEGDYPVITDSPKWNEEFAGYKRLYGFVPRPTNAAPLPSILVGAWFNGEEFSGRHLLIEDQGLWPGGLGANTPGGLTLINPRDWPEAFEVALERTKDELKAKGYRGLVKVGLRLAPEGQPGEYETSLVGFEAGWNFLQHHALLAEAGDYDTPNITSILNGAEPAFYHRFTVVIPVSIAPYPYHSDSKTDRLPIPEGAIKCGHVFWHDMLVEDGVVRTAALDGLVGVVRASADSLMLARGRALAFAKLIALPELQVRVDVGEQVEGTLAFLEGRGLPV